MPAPLLSHRPPVGGVRRPGASVNPLNGLPGSPGKAVSSKALKSQSPRLAPAHSALVRQKGLAGKQLAADRGDLKKAKGAAKGAAGKELAQAKSLKKAAVPVRKAAAKDAAGLKQATGLKKKAALKAMAPARSAPCCGRKGLRPKQTTGGRSRGDLKKAKRRGQGGGGGRSWRKAKSLKKAAVPVRKAAAKDAAGLKQAAGLKKEGRLESVSGPGPLLPVAAEEADRAAAGGPKVYDDQGDGRDQKGGPAKQNRADIKGRAGSSMKKVRSSVPKSPLAAKKLWWHNPKRHSQCAAAVQILGLFRGGFPKTMNDSLHELADSRACTRRQALTRNGHGTDGQDRLTYRQALEPPCFSCTTSPCCTYLLLGDFRIETLLDVDHAVYLSNFEGIYLGLDPDRKVDIYFHQPCGYLDVPSGLCTVHGTPVQPAVCVQYNAHVCGYRHRMTADVDRDRPHLDARRVEWLAEHTVFDDDRRVVALPDWEEMLDAFGTMPLTRTPAAAPAPDPITEEWRSIVLSPKAPEGATPTAALQRSRGGGPVHGMRSLVLPDPHLQPGYAGRRLAARVPAVLPRVSRGRNRGRRRQLGHHRSHQMPAISEDNRCGVFRDGWERPLEVRPITTRSAVPTRRHFGDPRPPDIMRVGRRQFRLRRRFHRLRRPGPDRGHPPARRAASNT